MNVIIEDAMPAYLHGKRGYEMFTVLLTGFGPFGTTPVNPAEKVAKILDGKTVGEAKIVSRIVPDEFFKVIDFTKSLIDEVKPRAVLMMGEYGGRSMITVERIAQNFNDATRYNLKDNAGLAPQGARTAEDGPAAYFATVPIRAMVKAMREDGIPADISDTGGTFVCNHLMYGALHYIATAGLDIPAGWIHLPALPSTAVLKERFGEPSMSAETSAAGVMACIRAVVEHPVDIEEPIFSRFLV